MLLFSHPSEELVSPVLVSNEGSSQLDIMAGVGLELAHRGATLFDHVEKHLRQLRVLVQIHQVGKTVVHFEGHSSFLITQTKNYLWGGGVISFVFCFFFNNISV